MIYATRITWNEGGMSPQRKKSFLVIKVGVFEIGKHVERNFAISVLGTLKCYNEFQVC